MPTSEAEGEEAIGSGQLAVCSKQFTVGSDQMAVISRRYAVDSDLLILCMGLK